MAIRRSLFFRIIILFLNIVFAGISLSACEPSDGILFPSTTVTFTPFHTETAPFTPPSPTSSPSIPPLATSTPTASPTFTEKPTSTPIPYHYVFPIQPSGAAGFAEGTASHGYPATDIFALVGTRFVAVTDGIVDFVSYKDTWDPATDDPAVRGGLSVAILGDDGVRYYGSHLSAIADGIKPGARVAAGQVLGLVGKSGDAIHTTSHLHFGISRPSTPDDWKARRGQVDPFPFLQAWRDGYTITPPLPVP
jgi:murein DD-endopeptidase MepM/ murein hydrolase activator NlpD